MLWDKASLEAPATTRYHREAIEQIIQSVEERVYCAVLGPRLCGKTILLRYIQHNLSKLLGWKCIYLDLMEIRAATQGGFFMDLARMVSEQLSELHELDLPPEGTQAATSAMFRAFLADCLEALDDDLVIILDPLEALPTDMVQALLTSLRAAYMDQQTQARQATVVVSGALSLANLTVGESSPFRGIVRRVFIGDLSALDSQALILDFLAEYGVSATKPAVEKLLLATSGDTYLIRKLCQRAAEIVGSRSSKQLRAGDVTSIIDRFLRQEVFQYAPLVEGIRLIEEDPNLLESILLLLDRESVPRSMLPLPLSPDLDPLYLTGVVELVEEGDYRLQNQIYRLFLEGHFTPGHVGHVMAMSGRWDSAIDYLEASLLSGNPGSRADLLPAVVNSMYASEDLTQAVHFLRRGLSAAFGVTDSLVWFTNPQEKFLQLISPPDVEKGVELWTHPQIAISADRLEARAYRQSILLRGQESEDQIIRAVPLKVPGDKPIGVVTLYNDLVDDLHSEQREHDFELLGFLNQAARALRTVNDRRQELTLAGRMQASLLPDKQPHLPGWQVAAAWRPARETSGDFYDFISLPDGRLAIVMADVVDKGMGAALLMALSRTLIRTYAWEHPDHPEELLEIVNQRIFEDSDASLFVSLFYGVLDPSNGELCFCNAGLPHPYIFSPTGRAEIQELPATGVPLGISDDATWHPESAHIPPGGSLVLYTDGVLDARNPKGQVFGRESFQNLIHTKLGNSASQMTDELVSSVYAFAAGEPQVDDITIMVLHRDPATSDTAKERGD